MFTCSGNSLFQYIFFCFLRLYAFTGDAEGDAVSHVRQLDLMRCHATIDDAIQQPHKLQECIKYIKTTLNASLRFPTIFFLFSYSWLLLFDDGYNKYERKRGRMSERRRKKNSDGFFRFFRNAFHKLTSTFFCFCSFRLFVLNRFFRIAYFCFSFLCFHLFFLFLFHQTSSHFTLRKITKYTIYSTKYKLNSYRSFSTLSHFRIFIFFFFCQSKQKKTIFFSFYL